tara:strand:+ start:2479 stop:3093 length:615 start_codon:yes stop_codon:yes gene_type:complete
MKNKFTQGLLIGMNLILATFLLMGAVSVDKNDSFSGANSESKSFSADPLLGEITMFAGNFAPRGWAFCDGRLLAISQYSALFSILGTTYGGDGRTTFALPDLRGRVPIQQGSAPGLSNYQLGQKGGSEQVTITLQNLPSHNHGLPISANGIKGGNPNALAVVQTDSLTNAGTGEVGGNLPIGIRQPYTAVNYIIALQGIFPSRN